MSKPAQYKVRRHTEDSPFGSRITLYRVEVYNGGKLVLVTRDRLDKRQALADAQKYVAAHFTVPTMIPKVR